MENFRKARASNENKQRTGIHSHFADKRVKSIRSREHNAEELVANAKHARDAANAAIEAADAVAKEEAEIAQVAADAEAVVEKEQRESVQFKKHLSQIEAEAKAAHAQEEEAQKIYEVEEAKIESKAAEEQTKIESMKAALDQRDDSDKYDTLKAQAAQLEKAAQDAEKEVEANSKPLV